MIYGGIMGTTSGVTGGLAATAPQVVESAKTASEIDPSFTDVYYDLSQIYEREGQADRAIAAYEKYLKLDPPAELRASAREALQNLKRK